jgi:hypothetical protein
MTLAIAAAEILFSPCVGSSSAVVMDMDMDMDIDIEADAMTSVECKTKVGSYSPSTFALKKKKKG